MQRFICGLMLLGIILSIIGMDLTYPAMPRSVIGHEDLIASVAPYSWRIVDVVVSEEAGVIIIYYYYEKPGFASDDTDWIKGLDIVAEWASHHGFLKGLVLISLYVEEGYGADMQPSAHFRMGAAILWRADALRFYLANASEFESFFHVMTFSQSLRWLGAGGFEFIDRVWEPHPLGLWRNLPREREMNWEHLR